MLRTHSLTRLLKQSIDQQCITIKLITVKNQVKKQRSGDENRESRNTKYSAAALKAKVSTQRASVRADVEQATKIISSGVNKIAA